MTKRVIKKRKKQEKIKTDNLNFDLNIKKILSTTLIVLLILLVCYFIVGMFITKDIKLFDNKKEDVIIQNEKILITQTFSMSDDEYYVFMYDEENDDYEQINNAINNVQNQKIYKVDLQNGINAAKVGTPSNVNAQNYNDLKINGNTLIKIVNGKNVLYLDNKNEIINNFN